MHMWILIALATCLVFICQDETADLSDRVKGLLNRQTLRAKARNMFLHGFNSYLRYAFPADELMPLSCGGRYRMSNNPRGDIDDALGNFSLTLVDSMDGLALLGLYDEFEDAVNKTINGVNFNITAPVNVFEVNIRVLGGLLSSHILCKHLQNRSNGDKFAWYNDELLSLAWKLGKKLLPAFKTKSGLPRTKVPLSEPSCDNRSYDVVTESQPACTACCGTFILEFHTLSHLTGDWSFAQKAFNAMEVLWKLRDRNTNLLGSTIDVESAEWIRKDSSIGAGSDSYYEYLLKGYIAFGIDDYFYRFDKVEFGKVKEAVQFHEFLFQVVLIHGQMPEAFTSDLQVYWPDSLLRPELAESTYYLYKVTRDSYYLEVARFLLETIEQSNRVSCGYAAFGDLTKKEFQDRMDSFFLAETLKYLYLIFSDPSELPINLDSFVFSTEAHLIPIVRYRPQHQRLIEHGGLVDTQNTKCRSAYVRPDQLRQLRREVQDSISQRFRNLADQSNRIAASTASELLTMKLDSINLDDSEHRLKLMDCGIILFKGEKEGAYKIAYSDVLAKSPVHAEFGKKYWNYLTRIANNREENHHHYAFMFDPLESLQRVKTFNCTVALFSHSQTKQVMGIIKTPGNDAWGCEPSLAGIKGSIALIKRGQCGFFKKVDDAKPHTLGSPIQVHNARESGAIAVLIYDETIDSPVQMDGQENISFPALFLTGFKNGHNVDHIAIIAKRANDSFSIADVCETRAGVGALDSNQSVFELVRSHCRYGTRHHRILFFVHIGNREGAPVYKLLDWACIRNVQSEFHFTVAGNGSLIVSHQPYDECSHTFQLWVEMYWDLLKPTRSGLCMLDIFQLWRGADVVIDWTSDLGYLVGQLNWVDPIIDKMYWIVKNV